MLQKKLKRMKKRLKKRIYNFLLILNEFDFSKLKPLVFGTAFLALLITACLLPTTTKNNASSSEVACGLSIATSIRSAVSDYSTLECDADVVAVFLPMNHESLSENELLGYMEDKTLYSFYLTGKELSYLAECAVTIQNDTQVLYLDGLNYTYHENRLPFDRICELSLTGSEAIASDKTTLYHIITTEEIFTLFHYGAYRSFGLVEVTPKNPYGITLSDYQEAIVAKDNTPLTAASAIAYTAMYPTVTVAVTPEVSTVTKLGGFNLIALLSAPSLSTVLVWVLFFTVVVLLWYIIPRLHRVVLWTRIYIIRSKKRGRHIYYTHKKPSHSGLSRRAG